MDELTILNLLLDYGYIEAVIVLFRVNKLTYENFNFKLLRDKLKLADSRDLRELYYTYLIDRELNDNDYNMIVTRYSYLTGYKVKLSDLEYNAISTRYNSLMGYQQNVNWNQNQIFAILFNKGYKYPYNNTKVSALIVSILQLGNVNLLKIVQRILHLNFTVNNYRKQLYEHFRDNYIGSNDLYSEVHFIFKDESRELDKIKIEIWKKLHGRENKESILSVCNNRDSILLLRNCYERNYNNRDLIRYIRYIGVDRVENNIDIYWRKGLYEKRLMKCINSS